ncbi:hypothetical protein PTKU46_80500 [Paraburkholderia terrae]
MNAAVDGLEPVSAELDMFIPGIDALCWAFEGNAAILSVMQARTEAIRRAVELFISLKVQGRGSRQLCDDAYLRQVELPQYLSVDVKARVDTLSNQGDMQQNPEQRPFDDILEDVLVEGGVNRAAG